MSPRSRLLLLAPWLAILVVFLLAPFVASFVLSFFESSPLTPEGARFVGFDQYRALAHDSFFFRSLGNTFLFVLGTVPATTLLALVLALLVHHLLPARGVFRAILFVPAVLSIVVLSILFREVYAPLGLLNHLVRAAGGEGRAWLQDPSLALPAIMVMAVWGSAGYYMLLFLAGLQSVPRELEESATVDGAGFFARLRHLTLPWIAPITLLVVVVNAIRSFQVFVEPLVMTGGGPLDRTLTMVLYLYERAFRRFELGYASALAYSLFVVILGASIVQVKAFRQGGGAA